MKRSNKDRLWLAAAAMLVAHLGFSCFRVDADPRDKFAPQYMSCSEYKGLKTGESIEQMVQKLGEPIGEYLLDDSTQVYLYQMEGPAPDALHVYLNDNDKKVVRIGHAL